MTTFRVSVGGIIIFCLYRNGVIFKDEEKAKKKSVLPVAVKTPMAKTPIAKTPIPKQYSRTPPPDNDYDDDDSESKNSRKISKF